MKAEETKLISRVHKRRQSEFAMLLSLIFAYNRREAVSIRIIDLTWTVDIYSDILSKSHRLGMQHKTAAPNGFPTNGRLNGWLVSGF